MEFEYKENSFFNEKDTFVFLRDGKPLETKVHFHKGYWYMNKYPFGKATTFECKLNQ